MTQADRAKTSTPEKVLDLDELQQEAQKLVALLKDRQPGLMTWNEMVRDRLTSIHAMTERYFGKKA